MTEHCISDMSPDLLAWSSSGPALSHISPSYHQCPIISSFFYFSLALLETFPEILPQCVTGKHLGVEASNNNTIGSSFMFSGRGVVKIPGIVSTGSGPNPVILSSDSQNPSNPRNGHNSETLSGGSINSSNTGSGATSKSISANTGDKLNSKNPSDFQNLLNRGNAPVEGAKTRAKTGNQSSGSQTPLNTGSRPNPEMLSSGSQNPSNARNGLNSETPSGGSLNSSNTGSGATSKSISANTGDIPANSRNPSDLQSPNPSDFQNPLNRGNTPVEGAKTGIQSPGSQTPLNTGSRPNPEMLSSGSQNLSNPRIGLNSKTLSGGSINSSNAGSGATSKSISANTGDISANSRNPSDLQNPVSSRKGTGDKLNSKNPSDFQNPLNRGNAPVEGAKTGIQSPGSQTPLNTGSRPNSEMLSSDSQNLSNPRIGLNSETPSGGSVKPSNAGGISANSRNPSDFQNPVSSKKGHAEGTNADIQSPGFQNSPNNGQEAGIDASKTSDTRANISPSKDSQQKAKISIGNQIQPDTVPKKTPVSTAYNEAPSSAHFMGYFLTAIVLCIAGYIVFHNKQKIIAFIIEGRNQKRGRRPNANEYKKLQTNVDDVMVSLDKSTTAQNYIY
ncbi:trans-Golgi network integral membrane protein 2 [Octopus bimaculoides]|uniref:trans-Golgi network integral membrane protein 2 n=1 Tax=Octopus bimaculoides TaxID=37653 RepID=UPI0022E1224E|nr:trans-Golgi network integral membrane protein 2 [Octopus bimaculoides]